MRQPVPYTPIWIMRQAGRYMKEYMEVRSKVSFLELCRTPELASKVTLDAAHLLDVDAAIIFADILLITETLGFDLRFNPGDGPKIENPFRTSSDVRRLARTDSRAHLSYVGEAVAKTRASLRDEKSLIGFAGAPYTVASYAIEGAGSKNYEHVRVLMKDEPAAWNALLSAITSQTLDYLSMQVEAGADVLQIFDSWVGTLSAKEFESSVVPHLRSLVSGLRERHPDVPLIYFGTNTGHLLRSIQSHLPVDVVGIDSKVDLEDAKTILANKALQGNLDPTTLLCGTQTIEREAQAILDSMKGRDGFIFNLGHGILPMTDFAKAKHLVDWVHAARP